MRRIIFILEEFYRSFKKGIFRNILLAVMFSLSLIMTVIMSSYYLDIGDRYARLDDADAPVPVVLGNDYKGLVDIGGEFDVLYWGYVYRCKVIGILEKEAATPILGYSGVCYAPSCVLDSHVIFQLGIKLSELVARYIFFVKNVSLCYKDVIVKFAYNCSGFVCVAGTFLIIMLLRGVNIEHIIRQKD